MLGFLAWRPNRCQPSLVLLTRSYGFNRIKIALVPNESTNLYVLNMMETLLSDKIQLLLDSIGYKILEYCIKQYYDQALSFSLENLLLHSSKYSDFK